MRVMGTIIDHFQVPHPAPEPVEQASAKFEQLADEYRKAQALYYGGVTSRLDDIREANTAAAAARIKGEKFSGKTEAKIDADIAKAKTEMETLAEAVDMAGDTLVQAVADHRDAWRATYDAADQEATQRVLDLTESLRLSTADVHAARAASEWLGTFNRASTQFVGGTGYSGVSFDQLEKLVHGERRLAGYREGQPIWVTEKVV